MPGDHFALALERYVGGTTVLVLAGEIDLYRAREVEHALAEAIGAGGDGVRRRGRGRTLSADVGEAASSRRVVVDLSAVTFLDSTMLAILLGAQRRQRGRGCELLVVVGPETPTTAFEATRVDRLLAIRRLGPGPGGEAA